MTSLHASPLSALRQSPEVMRQYGVASQIEGVPSPNAGVCHFLFSDRAYAPGGKTAEIVPIYGFRDGGWECRWLTQVMRARAPGFSMGAHAVERACLGSVQEVRDYLWSKGLEQSPERYQEMAQTMLSFLQEVETGIRAAPAPAAEGWWVSQASALAEWLGEDVAGEWFGRHEPMQMAGVPAQWWQIWDESAPPRPARAFSP